MTFGEIFRQAFATFKAHKMRTFLTMFGIVWGIASVILLVGLGRGFTVDQKKHMETLGKDQCSGRRIGCRPGDYAHHRRRPPYSQ
jgi:putative ABC transport system permease protein